MKGNHLTEVMLTILLNFIGDFTGRHTSGENINEDFFSRLSSRSYAGCFICPRIRFIERKLDKDDSIHSVFSAVSYMGWDNNKEIIPFMFLSRFYRNIQNGTRMGVFCFNMVEDNFIPFNYNWLQGSHDVVDRIGNIPFYGQG